MDVLGELGGVGHGQTVARRVGSREERRADESGCVGLAL
jgi:hypothetical protein